MRSKTHYEQKIILSLYHLPNNFDRWHHLVSKTDAFTKPCFFLVSRLLLKTVKTFHCVCSIISTINQPSVMIFLLWHPQQYFLTACKFLKHNSTGKWPYQRDKTMWRNWPYMALLDVPKCYYCGVDNANFLTNLDLF